MTSVREQVSFHESTVQQLVDGPPDLPRQRRSERRPRSSSVSVIRVHPLVMAAALKAADGDASRLEIVSATEVLVR